MNIYKDIFINLNLNLNLIFIILIESSILSIINLCCYVPILLALITKSQYLHSDVTSDIPGNIQAFNTSIISLFRTLPEPSNFNIVYTNIPLTQTLIIRGSITSLARCNSLSIYGRDSIESPSTIDLEIESNQTSFEILILPATTKEASSSSIRQLICPKGAKFGFMAIRNYCVPPGVKIITPELINHEGKVIRPSKVLITGPAAIVLQSFITSNEFKILIKLIVINLIIFLFNNYYLFIILYVNVCIITFCLFLSYLLYCLMFIIGSRRLKKSFYEYCIEKNKFYLASDSAGAKSSQPSLLHEYWGCRYDVTKISITNELSIQGEININSQKYWSLVAYDLNGLPLSQYIYDDNVIKIPTLDHNIYKYNIHLTNNNNKKINNKKRNNNITEFDISNCQIGYLLFRYVHPNNDIRDKNNLCPIINYEEY